MTAALAVDCCERSAWEASRTHTAVTCSCGAEIVPRYDPERALQQLQRDTEALARWGPHYQGRAMDLQRTRRPVGMDTRTPEEIEAAERRAEQECAAARPLFVRLEALRTEAHRTRGTDLLRSLAVIDWLVGHCGSERTKGHRVGSEVRTPKLARLVGEAFADEATKRRATPPPRVKPQPPNDDPPKPPPPLVLSDDPVDGPRLRAQEKLAHEIVTGRYVVEVLAWLLRRALYERALRTAKDAQDDAQGALSAIERHGVELLADAAWLWNEARKR